MYIEVWLALNYGCGIPAMFHYFVHAVFLDLSGRFGDSFFFLMVCAQTCTCSLCLFWHSCVGFTVCRVNRTSESNSWLLPCSEGMHPLKKVSFSSLDSLLSYEEASKRCNIFITPFRHWPTSLFLSAGSPLCPDWNISTWFVWFCNPLTFNLVPPLFSILNCGLWPECPKFPSASAVLRDNYQM